MKQFWKQKWKLIMWISFQTKLKSIEKENSHFLPIFTWQKKNETLPLTVGLASWLWWQKQKLRHCAISSWCYCLGLVTFSWRSCAAASFGVLFCVWLPLSCVPALPDDLLNGKFRPLGFSLVSNCHLGFTSPNNFICSLLNCLFAYRFPPRHPKQYLHNWQSIMITLENGAWIIKVQIVVYWSSEFNDRAMK